jgi:hypothetical protein
MTKSFPEKWPVLIVLFVSAVLAACLPTLAQQQGAFSTTAHSMPAIRAASDAADSAVKSDTAAAQAAFNRAWPVFASPRCRNCHPSGDAPLQGDDGHVHIQDVKRRRRQRRLRNEMQHLPPSRESSGRQHAAGESEMVAAAR